MTDMAQADRTLYRTHTPRSKEEQDALFERHRQRMLEFREEDGEPMKYLTRDNLPKKITSRQLSGFFKAKKEWLSANDAYNKAHFGIDTLTYKWIDQAVSSLVGICGPKPKLADVNRWLATDHRLYDEEGRYLTYLNKTIRYA